jgi:tetratricopeptide (TPR) repeat protein
LGCTAMTALAPARAADTVVAARAEKLFYEGLDALGRRDYERAREDFEASVALVARGSALRNLATVDWALGRHLDALKHLRAALQTADLPAEMRVRASADLDAAYAATGHIAVNTDAGATVLVDGARVDGTAPLGDPLDVEPGVRVVETRLGDRVARSEVDAKPGVVVKADVRVGPALGPPASAVPTPTEAPRDRDGSEGWTPHSFWNTRRGLGAALTGVGVASLAVGVGFFVEAVSQEDRASSAAAGLGPSSCSAPAPPASCATLTDALSAQRTDAVVSRVLIGVGIVGALAGGAMLLWPEPVRTHGVAVLPLIHPSGSEIAVEGKF